jgi:acetylornithine deacetylase/succinyl-diaminopimelate desuccinylase-like protein
MLKTANWLKEKMESAGVDFARIDETAGHPIVYAEKIIDPNLPTVLVYGHYDVQPADPLELWDTPPFEPEVRETKIHPEGAIFARGACDDKGQMYMHLKAFESMVANNELPCNVKFMIEGEEEVGSENLGIYIKENKDALKADVILISDTGIIAKDIPSLTVGLRGLSYMEVEVIGPDRDLHSGLYGGAVANPINVLCDMISSLVDDNGHITIPGFYDKVLEISTYERTEMAKAPFDQENFNTSIGIKKESGERGFTTSERTSIRPTLDVNGIWGGYTGEGAKTVLPSTAHAKISMRLVPDQNYIEISKLFEEHFRAIAPDSVSVNVITMHGGQGYVVPTDFTAYKAASKAMEITFGKNPIPVRSGGSIPIVALFEEVLGVKSILMGFGLDSDAIHSPNENYGLFNFYQGIKTIPFFFDEYMKMKK